MKYYYDLHMHSCLSPCGDDDMTPNNIAGMAKLNGMNIVALTDHNTLLNCPAFFKAAEGYGLTPVAGAELTTAEDIHIVCLFEALEKALAFGEEVNSRRILIENRAEIFGHQFILDGEDEITGEEKYLLPNATQITYEEVPALVEQYGGVCWPAHIDRSANGVIETLGTFPEEPDYAFAEFADKGNIDTYISRYPILAGKSFIVSSDAHYLENMPDACNYFELQCDPQNTCEVRRELFGFLRKGVKP